MTTDHDGFITVVELRLPGNELRLVVLDDLHDGRHHRTVLCTVGSAKGETRALSSVGTPHC